MGTVKSVLCTPAAEPNPAISNATTLAQSYRDTGQIIPSVSVTHESLRLDPENLDGHVLLCTDYSLSNSPEDARRVGQEILRIDPSFSTPRYVETQPYKDSAALEVIVKALREAGLPD